jgi:hypothetical protein
MRSGGFDLAKGFLWTAGYPHYFKIISETAQCTCHELTAHVVSIGYKYANPIARNAHYFTSLLCQRFGLKWRLERMVYPCPQITVDKEPLTKRKRFDKEPGKGSWLHLYRTKPHQPRVAPS